MPLFLILVNQLSGNFGVNNFFKKKKMVWTGTVIDIACGYGTGPAWPGAFLPKEQRRRWHSVRTSSGNHDALFVHVHG